MSGFSDIAKDAETLLCLALRRRRRGRLERVAVRVACAYLGPARAAPLIERARLGRLSSPTAGRAAEAETAEPKAATPTGLKHRGTREATPTDGEPIHSPPWREATTLLASVGKRQTK